MNKPKLKKIPRFKNETQEREFWLTHDTTDYFDWSKAIKNPQFPNLEFTNFKPAKKTITMRMPQEMYDNLKNMANKIDVPYQSYMKVLLADKIRELKLADESVKKYQATQKKSYKKCTTNAETIDVTTSTCQK